jgi:uncharacterized protein (TIGR02996 family)
MSMDKLAEHEGFLRAIFDAPDDDLPRLVYADFLEENGEPERAALIRVQCELAALRRRSEPVEGHELRTRERELLDRLHPELELIHWTPEEQTRIGHDRGFLIEPTAVVCPGELGDVTGVREKIIRVRPHWFGVQRMAVQPGWFLYPEHVEVLFGLAALQRVPEWDLGGYVEEATGGPLTAEAGTYALIDMNQEPVIRVDGVEALAGHRGARRITTLILTNNNLDNDAARALVGSPYLDNLKRLEFRTGNDLRGRTWQQLLERFGEDVVS